jgi:hypothetical protein
MPLITFYFTDLSDWFKFQLKVDDNTKLSTLIPSIRKYLKIPHDHIDIIGSHYKKHFFLMNDITPKIAKERFLRCLSATSDNYKLIDINYDINTSFMKNEYDFIIDINNMIKKVV